MSHDGPRPSVRAAITRTQFAETYAEHRDALVRHAQGILPTHEAEEVVHETLLGYWLRPDRHDPARGSVRTYLRMAVRGRAIDRLRSTDSSRQRDTIWTVDAASAFGDDVHHRREDILDALGLLPIEQREAIVTAFFNGLTYSQAAAALDVPEGTIKTRIRSGIIRLRAILADEAGGGDPSAR